MLGSIWQNTINNLIKMYKTWGGFFSVFEKNMQNWNRKWHCTLEKVLPACMQFLEVSMSATHNRPFFSLQKTLRARKYQLKKASRFTFLFRSLNSNKFRQNLASMVMNNENMGLSQQVLVLLEASVHLWREHEFQGK